MADYRKMARDAAIRHGIDPNIFSAQINAESGFNPNSGSSAGAQGIAQFMPATARSLGINPHNSKQALDAAAKLMAGYVKKYNSWDKALRAYNAGEGAIEKSHGYGETNAYVAKILNGKTPSAKVAKGTPATSASGAGTRVTSATSTVKQPDTTTEVSGTKTQFDQAGYDRASKQAAVRGFLESSGGKWGLLNSVLPQTADPASFTSIVPTSKTVTIPGATTTTTVKGTAPAGASASPVRGGTSGGGKVPGLQGKGSGLLELIYNGDNKGYAAKKGQAVDGPSFYSSVWAGHANHVHVAAGPKTVVGLGKLAQQMGLHVGENPNFGGVDAGAHVAGSYHVKGEAIDVSAPMTPAGKKKMAKYAATVERIYGIKQ